MIFTAKRGYRRGASTEIKLFIDLLIGIVCAVLILVLHSATRNHKYGMIIVTAAGLIILGLGWRLIKLITGPLSGLKSLGPVRTIDSFFGIFLGMLEGLAAGWAVIYALEYFDILERGLFGLLKI